MQLSTRQCRYFLLRKAPTAGGGSALCGMQNKAGKHVAQRWVKHCVHQDGAPSCCCSRELISQDACRSEFARAPGTCMYRSVKPYTKSVCTIPQHTPSQLPCKLPDTDLCRDLYMALRMPKHYHHTGLLGIPDLTRVRTCAVPSVLPLGCNSLARRATPSKWALPSVPATVPPTGPSSSSCTPPRGMSRLAPAAAAASAGVGPRAGLGAEAADAGSSLSAAPDATSAAAAATSVATWAFAVAGPAGGGVCSSCQTFTAAWLCVHAYIDGRTRIFVTLHTSMRHLPLQLLQAATQQQAERCKRGLP